MAEVPYPLVGAVSTGSSLLLASNSSIHLIDTASSSTISFTLPPSSTSSVFIRQIAISPDATHAATVSDDKGLRVYSLSSNPITHLSTRYLTKKSSCLSFSPSGDILVSDKVGDCYLYPLEARAVSAEKLKKLDVQADPTLNPEADYLLGHVSVVTSHLMPEAESSASAVGGGKRQYLITADRDEHIRITRYPDTYVIESYLFGTDGFVSSIHIPLGRPELLISGGGEGVLRIWDWKAAKQVGSVDIQDAVLPHRAARSTLRKDKRKGKGGKKAVVSAGQTEPETKKDFYDVPAGWMLPSSQGVLIREITSLRIADSTVVLFFSEGAAAIHSFIFPDDPTSSPVVQTLPTDFPVLDYTLLPGSQDEILVSLDTTFGIVSFNQEVGQPPKRELAITVQQKDQMHKSYRIIKVASDGSFSDITSSHPLSTTLSSLVGSHINQASAQVLSSLNLYPNLSLYPRWPGLEEDDDLAGPATEQIDQAQAPAQVGKPKKEYTQEEYSAMNLKYLGRLKAQGYAVDEVMRTKRREKKDKAFDAKRRKLEEGAEGTEEQGDEEEEGEGEEDDEEAGNA